MTDLTSAVPPRCASLLRRIGQFGGSLALVAAVPLAGLFSIASANAQLRYVERSFLGERHRCGITFDELRGRLVLFGGFTGRTGLSGGNALNDTYEAESFGWVRRTPLATPPTSDLASAIAFDLVNKRVIFHTYGQASRQPETWRYDGRNWGRILGLANNPPFRQNYATAFDYDRNVLVMFGGSDTAGMLLDTWEFDGTDWRQIATPGPSGRQDPAMTYDATLRRVVLFGGRNATQQPLGDTWTWNGATWAQLTPAASPPARHSTSLEYDRARAEIVLFGGATGLPGTRFADTWVFSNGTWTQRTPARSPAARNGHAATYRNDRNHVVIACGDGVLGQYSDTWEWDGTNWTETIAAEAPTSRSECASCFDTDRREIVLFGGKDAGNANQNDTWAWRIANWRELHPATSPPTRSDHAMAHDSTRGRSVMFGGFGALGVLGDTWLWDGTNWTQASPATSPGTRMGHTMVWDSTRQVIVMFGGTRGATVLDDLWEWDGTDWRAVTPALRPAARWNHGMAYLAGQNQMVMFGGRNSFGGKLNDTWVYDGAAATWTQRVVSPAPAARDNFTMVYDEVRQRVSVFSGFGTNYLSDTWDWNGTTWTSVFALPSPAPRQSATVAFDTASRRALLFGGISPLGPRQESWLWTQNAIATVANHGQPCAGATGNAILTGFGTPSIGALSFAIDLASPVPPTTVPVFFILAAAAGTTTVGPCTLAIDAATIFYTAYRLQYGVGFASMALPLPATVQLYGAQFYAVAAYVDPPTQLNGLAFSQQAKVTIGD